MLSDWRKLRNECWGRHLWSRGYYVCTSGNVTEEMYIKNQGADPEEEERFKVTE
jgi:putative transposase